MPNAPLNLSDIWRVLGRKFSKTGDTIYAPSGTTSDILTAQIATATGPKNLLKVLPPTGLLEHVTQGVLLSMVAAQAIAIGASHLQAAFDTVIYDSDGLATTGASAHIQLPANSLATTDKTLWFCFTLANFNGGGGASFGTVIELFVDQGDGSGSLMRATGNFVGASATQLLVFYPAIIANGATGTAIVKYTNASGNALTVATSAASATTPQSPIFAAFRLGNTHP